MTQPPAATARTRVFTDLDYEAPGKRHGLLRVPQVRDDSGWGVVQIPLCVIRNGRGPTLLLTGGTHGDEYEGPIALMDLARALDAAELNGRLIIIPALHFPAAKAGRRTSPVDGTKSMPRPPECRSRFASVIGSSTLVT